MNWLDQLVASHNGIMRQTPIMALLPLRCYWLAALLAGTMLAAASLAAAQDAAPAPKAFPAALVEAGGVRFVQQCAFCHGRDAGGGEDGPDLTRSKLVADDRAGDQIGVVVRNGRPEKGMPRFTVSDPELSELVAFIKTQKTLAESQKGGRRGVDKEDLQTGDAGAGRKFLDGGGECSGAHA